MSSLTLARLVEVLGKATVEVLAAPAGLDVTVAGPRIYDPLDPGSIEAGDVVLAVNVTDLGDLLDVAAGAGAAAVVVKGFDAGDGAPVAVLSVSSSVTWNQVFTVVRNAAAIVAPEDEPAPIRDLFALANAVAALVGGAVSIEDPQSRMLAYSTLDQPIDEPRMQTILGRGLPAGSWATLLEEAGVLGQLIASPDKAVRVSDPEGNARPRLAAAITAGHELLGFLWVVEGERPLDDAAERALREAVPLAALHLLRHRASDDLTRRERGDLLRDLLSGRVASSEAAAGLGLDEGQPCAVVAFRLLIDDDLELSVKRTRAVDMITLACESFRRRVVCSTVGDTIYALFPALTSASAERLVAQITNMVEDARHVLDVSLVAGIGSTVPRLGDALASRAEADRVVRVLTSPPAVQAVAHIDQVRVPTILLGLGDVLRERPEFRLPALHLVAVHDADHSSSYIETLRAFVAAQGDIKGAAKALALHPNTIRYRMRRIDEISGLDLSDADHVLVVALHLLAEPDL